MNDDSISNRYQGRQIKRNPLCNKSVQKYSSGVLTSALKKKEGILTKKISREEGGTRKQVKTRLKCMFWRDPSLSFNKTGSILETSNRQRAMYKINKRNVQKQKNQPDTGSALVLNIHISLLDIHTHTSVHCAHTHRNGHTSSGIHAEVSRPRLLLYKQYGGGWRRPPCYSTSGEPT